MDHQAPGEVLRELNKLRSLLPRDRQVSILQLKLRIIREIANRSEFEFSSSHTHTHADTSEQTPN